MMAPRDHGRTEGAWTRRRVVGLAWLLGLGLLGGAATAPPVTVYLALGDSVAAGQGASRPEWSYVGRELTRLRAADRQGGVRLALYASGGTTSEGLRRWQAPAAAAELAAIRRGERPGLRPGPVTVTVGGNDLLSLQWRPGAGGPASEAAPGAVARRVEENLDAAVQMLLAALGPTGRVTLTTYYNPFAVLPADEPRGRASATATAALNAAIARVADRYPAQVRLARVDQALPADAAIGRFLADPIHPNDQGHAAIASAVARTWDEGSGIRDQGSGDEGAGMRGVR